MNACSLPFFCLLSHHHAPRPALPMRTLFALLLALLATCAPLTAAAPCDGLPQAACLAAAPECVWCVSAAVPASCYTAADAARLPPGVFACKTDGVVQEWVGVS